MITKSQFKTHIQKMKDSDAYLKKLSKLGIEVSNQNAWAASYFFLELMKNEFGQDGCDLIYSWLYEGTRKIYKAGTLSKEFYLKGEEVDGEVIAELKTAGDLYDYVVKEFAKKQSPYLEWEPCSEDNYPKESEICIVRVWEPSDELYCYYLESSCFMGWSTLIKRDAECVKFGKDEA